LRGDNDVTIQFTTSANADLAGNTMVQVEIPYQWGAVISSETYSGVSL